MAALEVLQAAQLEFVSPVAGNSPSYTVGQQVNVTWSTPWDFTNLQVFQGPQSDGSYALDVLGASLTQSETTYLWNSSSLTGGDLSAPFYFRLQKSDLPNDCDTCATNSPTFFVAERQSVTSTVSSTMESTSTSTASTAPSQVTDVAAAASSYLAAESANSHHGLSTGAKLGIGLGVGFGGVLLLIVLVLLLLLMRRRRKRRMSQEPDFQTVHREKEFGQMQSQMQEPMPVHSRPQTDYNSRNSGVADSFLTKSSGKTQSYHGPLDFEQEGNPRPGSERLFNHPVTVERMPSVLKQFRS